MDGFKSLLDTSYAKVFYHTLKQVKNNHDAADITQNTFFKAFLHFKTVKKPESLEPWLFTICNNEVKQFYRNSTKIAQLNEPRSDEPKTNEKHDELYAAIDQLSGIQRQMVLLKYFGGYSMKELALVLSIAPATVKSRLYEARQALKRILGSASFSPSLQKERRHALMATLKLCELGAKTIPSMSLNAQKQLLGCAKENAKFNTSVLAELATIPTGQEFMDISNGRLSYNELLKILACCDDATIYRIAGSDFRTWRSAPNNQLIKDIAALYKSSGFIDSVEPIVYVQSMLDTYKWYKKYLGWGCYDDESAATLQSDIDKWQHGIICPYANDGDQNSYQGFKGIHIRPSSGGTIQNCHCFIMVSGVEDIHAAIVEKGWGNITEINHYAWGTKGFCLTDLNGFTLEFCEWECR